MACSVQFVQLLVGLAVEWIKLPTRRPDCLIVFIMTADIPHTLSSGISIALVNPRRSGLQHSISLYYILDLTPNEPNPKAEKRKRERKEKS